MKLIKLLIFCYFVAACNSYVERVNDQDDVKTAEILVNGFYRSVERGKYDEVYDNYDKDLDLQDLKLTFKKKDSLFGKLISTSILNIQTQYVKEADSISTEYFAEVEVHYERGKSLETLGFLKTDKKDKVLRSYYLRQILDDKTTNPN